MRRLPRPVGSASPGGNDIGKLSTERIAACTHTAPSTSALGMRRCRQGARSVRARSEATMDPHAERECRWPHGRTARPGVELASGVGELHGQDVVPDARGSRSRRPPSPRGRRSPASSAQLLDGRGDERRVVGDLLPVLEVSTKKPNMQSSVAVTVSSPAMRNRKQMSRILAGQALAVDFSVEED
jgi:hypothetical protein